MNRSIVMDGDGITIRSMDESIVMNSNGITVRNVNNGDNLIQFESGNRSGSTHSTHDDGKFRIFSGAVTTPANYGFRYNDDSDNDVGHRQNQSSRNNQRVDSKKHHNRLISVKQKNKESRKIRIEFLGYDLVDAAVDKICDFCDENPNLSLIFGVTLIGLGLFIKKRST